MTALCTSHPSELLTCLLGRSAAKKLSALPLLRELRTATVSELMSTYGLTSTQATKTLAAVELARRLDGAQLQRGRSVRSSADIHQHARVIGLSDLAVEQFRCLLLDGKHRLLEDVLVSQGTLTSSPVHPREVFCPAIRVRAAAVVLMHNHPSGDPTPSDRDLELTRQLLEAGRVLNIDLLDHIILARNGLISLKEKALGGF